MNPRKNKNTFLVYDGPNTWGTGGVLVFTTGHDTKSVNPKTGDMIQVYILTRDESPTEAVISGLDEVVCGGCALRPLIARQLKANGESTIPCYVDKWRGPQAIYKSWQAGHVDSMTPKQASEAIATLRTCGCEAKHRRENCPSPGKPLGTREGAYGDPANVPPWVWEDLRSARIGKMTSYTHAWADNPALAAHTMASIDPQTWPDVDAALDKAHALGFRTYRVLADGEAPRADEIMCPEATGLTTCNKCGLCSGNLRPTSPSIVIPAIK